MNIPTIALDQISASQSQKEVTFNGLANALSSAVLFGIKQRETNGLRLTLYGGVFPTATGPVVLPDEAIDLTPSTTNYIYVNTAGVITKATVAPTGWPGPMATGYRALYQLSVGADAITNGTNYLVGPASPGPTGPQGATGLAGDGIDRRRKRLTIAIGADATTFQTVGFTTTFTASAGPSARTLGSTFLAESVPFTAFGGTGIGSSGQYYSSNFCYLGNAAGRGGFDVSFRWAFESTFSSASARRFVGLYDTSAGVFGNVEPDTILNLIGVGSKAGDANLSLIHNDGSGTATMTGLGASFPARATDDAYELRLTSVANSGTVDYLLTNLVSGATASGTISTDLPASTQFLGWYVWTNTGTNSTTTTLGFMQVAATTRY